MTKESEEILMQEFWSTSYEMAQIEAERVSEAFGESYIVTDYNSLGLIYKVLSPKDVINEPN